MSPDAREIRRRELVMPGPAEALAGLLGVELPDLERAGLPLLWHWLYLLDRPRQEDLGTDGHPTRNCIPASPGPGRRRMWAGGQVRYLKPLRVGTEASRLTRVESVIEKEGRTGRLTFVAVRHRIDQNGEPAVEERQDLVYRDLVSSPELREATTDEPAAPPPDTWSIDITPTLLFRYSALTYNAHRIHYDRDYATSVEGYPGLVTHGPLQAVAMVEAARRRGLVDSGPRVFDYRLIAPLYDHQGLVAQAARSAAGVGTAVADRWGRQTARGTLKPA